jgi:5'-nucleotidase
MNRSPVFFKVAIVLASILWGACGGAQQVAPPEPAPQTEARRPRILVTNDDGYSSEGIAALAGALSAFADVLVVAPLSNESGASQSHRAYKRESIRVSKVSIGDHLTGYAIDGSPTDCVFLGVRIFGEDRPFDLVVSGINYGENIGKTYGYSGTIGAAFEALGNDIPGIAVSQSKQRAEFATAAEFAALITQRVLAQPLDKGVLLSVNIPDGEITCVTAAPPDGPGYDMEIRPIGEDDGDMLYTSVRVPNDNPEPGTDLWAFRNGCITLTPLQLDRSHRPSLETIAGWEPSLNSFLN